MKLGAYEVTLEGVPSMLINFMDSLRVRVRGTPRVPGATPVEIAKAVLRANARAVLHAGAGHFWFMWAGDFGKALRGARHALEPGYLRDRIAFMIRESRRQGRVTSCFNRFHGFDMPYYRADNLPWLVDSTAEYVRSSGDRAFLEAHRDALAALLASYEREHLGAGLIARTMTGDWMDTILRPSSTWNNLCALHMLRRARELGLETATDPARFEALVLGARFRGDHFTDYDGTDEPSVDAAVLALYLEMFDAPLRDAIAARLEASGLADPYPIQLAPRPHDRRLMPLVSRLTPRYHSSTWLHVGLMYLNGLRRAGRDVSAARARVEALIMRHGNLLEVVDRSGAPYRTFAHSTEYGLSMAAGQYLELALA